MVALQPVMHSFVNNVVVLFTKWKILWLAELVRKPPSFVVQVRLNSNMLVLILRRLLVTSFPQSLTLTVHPLLRTGRLRFQEKPQNASASC